MRLFIAIPIPDDIKCAIHEQLEQLSLPGIRWTPLERWHLTLVFLGECDADTLPAVQQSLATATAEQRPFPIQLTQVQSFGNPHAPHCAVMVEPDPVLRTLQSRIAEAVGVVESRPYRPHISVGKATVGKPFRQSLTLLPVPVREIKLIESTLTAGGSRYQVRSTATLAA